jgi:predicted  nucleic acid-binding Zn-ribbon protein
VTVSTVDVQLTALLEIQDMRAKVRELREDSGVGRLEADHFGIDPKVAADTLEARIAELVDELSLPIRRRYERIAGHVDRVVVPVIGGICYGCFVSVPTATAGETDPNAELQSCEHCGRFLYFLP